MAAPLLDAAAAAEAREQALSRVRIGAEPAFIAGAMIAIVELAGRRSTFTTDDLWVALDAAGVAGPREPRALGAVMRQAQKDGLIAPSSMYVPSARVACHRRPVRVWRSLVAR